MEGGALNPDMLCRDSEEPACRVGMLPDAATGHGPDTLARKLSRRAPRDRREQRGCKEGMAWFLQIQVQVLSKPGVSRYKFYRSRYTVTVQNVF